ncbi:MAG: hypothetical protein OEW29_07080 [Acidimicrobiia bacterium]|nr:hypothetical protein [Acidimicrobiia bacterium]
MRFTKPYWAGIADGSVTVAFRRWRSPTVVAGRPYRTGGGRIEVLSVDVVDPAAITAADAVRAGHASPDEVRASLDAMADRQAPGDDRRVYRVEFRRLDEPDPRHELAHRAALAPDDVAAIDARLDRLDKASAIGPWTRSTLRLIAANERIRAPDLAASVGRETAPFKLDVRKLKNLGLTISLRVGYLVSPRGRAYLAAIDGGAPAAAPGGGGPAES